MISMDLNAEFHKETGRQADDGYHYNAYYVEWLENKLLVSSGVINCNCVKDPNIVKTYALITRKDGLKDVWRKGECLGEGLNTDGINKLNL